MTTRERHRHALLTLLEGALGSEHSDAFKQKIAEEILKISDRFTRNPSLDEALNSGNGTYKP